MPAPGRAKSFNDALAAAVTALGSVDFFSALDGALSALVANDYPQFWLFRRGEAPRSLYHTLRGKLKKLHVEGYIAGAYREDPIYRKSLEAEAPPLVRITEITATRFRQTEYFRRFHAATGNIDEATFIIRIDADTLINLPIMRVQGSGRFSMDDIERLRSVEPVVRALVLKHWEMMREPAVETTTPTETTSMAIEHFGRSLLSAREQDVLRLLLLGHSAKSAAERLGISPETLRRHRKTIYRKLDINSISELFSLFIGSLPYYDPALGNDPLERYLALPTDRTATN